MKLNRISASLLAALAVSLAAMPAAAQQDPTGEAQRRAESLDRLLGANADLPKPDAAPAQPLAWMAPPLPPWLAAQPYRQQPLFATVPVGGTVRGRVRGSGVP